MLRLIPLLLLALTACAHATATMPTLAVLPTVTETESKATPVVIPVAASEQNSPPDLPTDGAAFLVITPTPPPSKTPTATQSPSPTPSATPPPTDPSTATSTATALIPPTHYEPFITAVVVAPTQRVCDSEWYFIVPRPESCPAVRATISMATYQEFEGGYMIWLEQSDLIYVMYNNGRPAWETYEDLYIEGTEERDDFDLLPPPGDFFQPRRGFGKLWVLDANVRNRIGWATHLWEEVFSANAQTATDGTVFLDDPFGGIFQLSGDHSDWTRVLDVNEPSRIDQSLIPTLTPSPSGG